MGKVLTAKQIDREIEKAYYAGCSGIQIDIMDIGKIFAVGRQAYAQGARGEVLEAAVRELRGGNQEELMGKIYEFEAKFPLAERAERFAQRIAEPGWWAFEVVHKGRTVSFKVQTPEGFEEAPYNGPNQVFWDFLGTVGSFGSDQRRKATLDGVPAPMEY
jgi:hypothetical protein